LTPRSFGKGRGAVEGGRCDRGLEFVSAHRFDQESADQIPANMIGSASERHLSYR
jgi:hypothetical protein